MATVQVDPIAQPPTPNSVLLDLDGTKEEVLHRYVHCQNAYLNWNIEHATDKVEILLASGDVFKVFTTPIRSTFYYAMTYQGMYIVFVIEGRNGWLHGYYGVNGMYEFESMAQVEYYMNDERCKRLPFGGNHHEISAGNTGKTRIGLCALIDALCAIWKYNGDKEDPGFKTAFRTIVVHICESMKLRPVFRRICDAFTDTSVTKLGTDGSDFIERLITSWSYMSGQAMRAIDDTDYQICNTRKVPNISSEMDILTHIAVLHVDAHFGGIFQHDGAANPRHWEPLESGNGVLSFDDILFDDDDDDYGGGGCGGGGGGGGDDDDDDEGGNGDQQDGQSGGDGKGRHHGHGDSKGKGGGGGGGRKGQQRSGGRGRGGGAGRKRRGGGVSLSAALFPLIGEQSNATTRSDLNAHAGVEVMKESKYPWRQIINNCCLTSLSFYMINLLQRDLGAVAMTLGRDRLARTEAFKWIGNAFFGTRGILFYWVEVTNEADLFLDEVECCEEQSR